MQRQDARQAILAKAGVLSDRLVALRRGFALRPELSGEESHTAATVARHLRALGLSTEEGVGGHGVVAILEGETPGPTVVYRADMDAMPIRDELDTPYRSLALGVKHACGHDAHMAIALGVAELLVDVRAALRGHVLFLFQPAEESLAGAQAILETGLLQEWPVRAVLALHVLPIPIGTMAIVSGLCLAGVEEFRVRLYAPEGNLEALTAAAIAALEALSTARAPTTTEDFRAVVDQMLAGAPLDRTIFLSCWPHAEGHVPPYHILGLVSITDFDQRAAVYARIRAALDRVVARAGATYDLVVTFTNPPLINDPDLVGSITPALESALGESGILRFRAPYPFAHEDLARYAALAPTALFWLGTANSERRIASLLHTADFDIDEAALEIGARAMATALWALLNPDDRDSSRMPLQHPDEPPTHPAPSS